MSGNVQDSAAALTAWFQANQRDLPWRRPFQSARNLSSGTSAGLVRETPAILPSASTGSFGYIESSVLNGAATSAEPVPRRDPYGTWISEIMLQQTQVATVMEYYRRWMTRFPDIATLARAEEADVLEAWAGLGYYSRARNVLATARKVMSDHGGSFPWKREDLLGLKGVGEYTAGAIASLAFDLSEPILDGNIVRVFSRLNGIGYLPDTKEGRQTYWELARVWAGSGRPSLVNEGLMELGALVCAPRSPDCARCPLTAFCAAYAAGNQDAYPPARSRKDTVDVSGFAVVAFAGSGSAGRALLYTPGKPERLAGLLTFPVFAAEDLPALRAAWKAGLPALAEASLRPRAVTVTHSITHHRYRLRIVEARVEAGAVSGRLPVGYAWAPIADLDRMLVSSLPRKIWKAVGT